MKRFLLVFALVAVIIGAMFYFMPKDLQSYVRGFENAKCYVYCRSTQLPCENVGYGRIVECSLENLSDTLKNCKDVDGISFTFSATMAEFEETVKKLNLESERVYELENVVVISGFCSKLRGGVIIDGQIINAQIAYSDGVVSVGSPLLLGSY